MNSSPRPRGSKCRAARRDHTNRSHEIRGHHRKRLVVRHPCKRLDTGPMIRAMGESWQRRIDRAAYLAEAGEAARPLLLAYSQLLGLQRDCYERMRRSADRLTGSLDRDLPALRVCVAPMLAALATEGPPPVADEARRLLD